jgi:hypothetical protein
MSSIVKSYFQSITNGEKDALLGSAFRDKFFHKRDVDRLYDELPQDVKKIVDDMFNLAQRFKQIETKYRF